MDPGSSGRDCLRPYGAQYRRWNLTLPVIECFTSNVGPCDKLVGAVNVNDNFVVNKANKIDDDAPYDMICAPDFACADWHSDPADVDGAYAYYDNKPQDSGWRQKTIYFLLDCSPHVLTGRTGGENFGILAEVPILVE